MSLTALLESVVARLRSELTLTPAECGVQEDAQPDPDCGKRFLSVYAPDDAWRRGPNEVMMGIHEVFKVNVALTVRLGGASQDRYPQKIYLDARRSMDDLLRKVMLAIHLNSVSVVTGADQRLGTNFAEGFVEPLRWESTDAKPQVVDGRWFWSDDEKTMHYPAGLMQQVYFVDAQRLQSFSTME